MIQIIIPLTDYLDSVDRIDPYVTKGLRKYLGIGTICQEAFDPIEKLFSKVTLD